ncbi:MAG: hypothetical protein HFACDABA_02477 [Anaerolineales bacterium]|nr:hypothetical protein [Anaerolineales bacterium]
MPEGAREEDGLAVDNGLDTTIIAIIGAGDLRSRLGGVTDPRRAEGGRESLHPHKTPSAFGTSPKYDRDRLLVNKSTLVVFGGGRVGVSLRKSYPLVGIYDNYTAKNPSVCRCRHLREARN